MLGGSDIQVPAIKHAKELGHYVITCDYLPNNPGHIYADEYHNVSTIEKEKVLRLAERLNIDGILAYASDPAAPTAAYVGNKLNLPSNPYESVNILCRKDLFREFLLKHSFNCPKSHICSSIKEAANFFNELDGSAIIKPLDSSGSKGVIKITNLHELKDSFPSAMKFSRLEKVIVEEYIERDRYQLGCDGFVVNGNLAFTLFGDTHLDPDIGSMVPCSVSVPSLQRQDIIANSKNEIQRALHLLNITTGALRPDLLVDKQGRIYIIEIGPRSGGNLIPQLSHYCTGIDILDYTIKAALGDDCSQLKNGDEQKYFSHYVIHSKKSGVLKRLHKTENIKQNILEEHLTLKIGDYVNKYQSSLDRIGVMLLRYSDETEMLEKIYNMHEYYPVEVEGK